MDFFPSLFFSLSEAFYIVNLSLAHPLSPSGSLFLFFEFGSNVASFRIACFLCDLVDVKPSREIPFRWEALVCDRMDYYRITCCHALLSIAIHIPFME